jgi:hypothetical protein
LLVLTHADIDKKFLLETDASSYAYGTVASQKGHDGTYHPVAIYSKSMTLAERNYGILDKEALAIVKALQYWRHWLEVPKTQFIFFFLFLFFYNPSLSC